MARGSPVDRDQCARKTHYRSYAHARNDARAMRDHYSGRFAVYRCRVCGEGWLIGSVEETEVARRNRRDATG